jgi:hypothetical protein
MRTPALTSQIQHRITRDTVVQQLNLDQPVITLNDFVPRYVFWRENS